MYKPSNTKGYLNNKGGKNAFCGKRGNPKFKKTKLDEAPEGVPENPINAVDDKDPTEIETLETSQKEELEKV